jgi:hypothetical protein
VSELDLLNLARSTTEHQVTWFVQVITINFGMVVNRGSRIVNRRSDEA